MLNQEESDFFKSFLKKEMQVLEWGSGKSTLFFSQFVKKYCSIEHDIKWYSKIYKELPENVEIYLLLPNTENSLFIRKSLEHDGDYMEFKDYIEVADSLFLQKGKIDVILIDGRARVDCATHILPFINEETLVFVHDFKRPFYKPILDYYNLIEMKGSLALLRKKI